MRVGEPVVPDLALAAVGLGLGLWVGALFTLAHRDPVLLAVGLVAVAALLGGLRLGSTRRVPAIGGAVGIVVAIGVLAQRGPGGSIVVQNDTVGWVWQLGAVLVAAVVLAWPRIARAGSAQPSEDTMDS